MLKIELDEYFLNPEDKSMLIVIAELNEYDDDGNLIQQYSRSPFEFPSDEAQENIVNSIQEAYAGYFERLDAKKPTRKRRTIKRLSGVEF